MKTNLVKVEEEYFENTFILQAIIRPDSKATPAPPLEPLNSLSSAERENTKSILKCPRCAHMDNTRIHKSSYIDSLNDSIIVVITLCNLWSGLLSIDKGETVINFVDHRALWLEVSGTVATFSILFTMYLFTVNNLFFVSCCGLSILIKISMGISFE